MNKLVILFVVQQCDLVGGLLTRDLQSCCFTLLCVEWACAPFGLAVVLSTVRIINRNYGICIIKCLNFISIMVPLIVPSRGHIDYACEGDRLSREHRVNL